MGVAINVKSLEEVPEIMREFVTEADGGFDYDFDKAFKALKEEREGRRADRKELASFKGLNVSPESIKAYLDLGKTPEEIAAVLATGSNNLDAMKFTEVEKARLTAEKDLKNLRSEFDKLKARIEESDRKAADADLRDKCEKIIGQLPDSIDRDKARLWLLGGATAEGLEVKGTYRNFTRNAIGDIEDINGLSPLDYVTAMSNALGYKKSSTPGNAAPGNATMTGNAGNAAYAAAKENGDYTSMALNCPTID
jgi:DNA-binding transcriptional MerR regulator